MIERVENKITEIAPDKAGGLIDLMTSVDDFLLNSPPSDAVASARNVLDEAKDNVLKAGTIEAVEDLKVRLYDISSSFGLTSEMPKEQMITEEKKVEKKIENFDEKSSLEQSLGQLQKMANDKEHPLNKEDFNHVLDSILAELLTDGTEFPTSPDFYKTLIVLVEKRKVEVPNDKSAQAQGDVVLAHLYSLLDKADRSSQFKIGMEIKIAATEIATSTPGYPAPTWKVEKPPVKILGNVAKIDIAKDKLTLSNGESLTFDQLEGVQGSLTFDQLEGGQGSLNRYYTGPDKYFTFYKSKYSSKIENLRNSATNAILTSHILELNKQVKLNRSNFPEGSVLLKRFEGKYFSLSKNGDITFQNDIPIVDLQYMYQELLKQFEVERIAGTQKALEDKMRNPNALTEDPYLEVRILFVTAQKQIFAGEANKGHATLAKFLKEVKGVPSSYKSDTQIEEGVKYATTVLKQYTLERIGRLTQFAQIIFSEKSYKKEYLDPMMAALKNEAERINSSEGFDINNSKLLDVSYFADKGSEQKKYEGMRSRGVSPIGILGVHLAGKIENPGRTAVDLWKKLVNFETSSDFDQLANESKKQQMLADLANIARANDMNIFSNEKYPAIAKIYFEDAVSPEVQYQQFKLREEKEKLFAQYKSDKNFQVYKERAADQISSMIKNDPESLKNILVSSGQMTDAQFESAKNKIASSPEAIAIIAEAMIRSKVEDQIDRRSLEELNNSAKKGDYSGMDLSIISSLTDMEGVGALNFKDSTVRNLAKELIITAIIMAASAGVGLIIEGGTAALLAGASARVARAAEAGSALAKAGEVGLRAVPYMGRISGFTGAENLISASIGRKELSWANFKKDFALNLMMFMAMDAGAFAWEKVAGKSLVGAQEGRKLLFNPSFGTNFIENVSVQDLRLAAANGDKFAKWMLRGRQALNTAGSTSMELSLFTGMGISQEMILGGKNWDEINIGQEFAMNLLTIAALKGGNMLFKPVIEPAYKAVEKVRVRAVENADPSLFLARTGIKSFGNMSPETVMNEYRAFEDQYGARNGFFKGKTVKETLRIISEVKKHTALSENLSAKDWKTLAVKDPEVCQVLMANKPKDSLNLTLTDLNEIIIAWEKAGIKINPEMATAIMRNMEKEVSALVTEANLKKLTEYLQGKFGDLGENFQDALASALRSGDKFAIGLIVLLTSSTAYAYPGEGIVGAVSGLTGIGWFILTSPILLSGVYAYARIKKGDKTVSYVGQAFSYVRNVGLRKAVKSAKGYSGDKQPKFKSSDLGRNVSQIANESGLTIQNVDVVIGRICKEYLSILDNLVDQTNPGSYQQIEGYKNQVKTRMNDLLAAVRINKAVGGVNSGYTSILDTFINTKNAAKINSCKTQAQTLMSDLLNTLRDARTQADVDNAIRDMGVRYGLLLDTLANTKNTIEITAAKRQVQVLVDNLLTTVNNAKIQLINANPRSQNIMTAAAFLPDPNVANILTSFDSLQARMMNIIQTDAYPQLADTDMMENAPWHRSPKKFQKRLDLFVALFLAGTVTNFLGSGIDTNPDTPNKASDRRAEAIDKIGDDLEFTAYSKLKEYYEAYKNDPNANVLLARGFKTAILEFITKHPAIIQDPDFGDPNIGISTSSLFEYYNRVINKMINAKEPIPGTNKYYYEFLGYNLKVTNWVTDLDQSSLIDSKTGNLAQHWEFPEVGEGRVRVITDAEYRDKTRQKYSK